MSSIRTRSPSTATSLMTPRSTSEITGISGSGISASAVPDAPAVTTRTDRGRAAHHRHLLPELRELGWPRRRPLNGVDLLAADPLRELRPELRREHAERVRPELVDRRS